MNEPRRSALYVGDVRHRRHRPRTNSFRYRVYWALIDVDELADLDRDVRGFGYGRAAIHSFRDTDHFGSAGTPVRLKLARWLADRDVTLPGGRVQVLTNLRVLGHVFNPVSWWFCHDTDGRLVLVVAEVHNTFGESHSYLLDDLDHRPDGTIRARAPKVFHVSPFLEIADHTYDFTFRPPADRMLVHMDVTSGGARVLDATQSGRRVALTSRSLATTALHHPLVTLRTVYLIHRQAWTLWRMRTPFVRRPSPPPDGYDDLDRPRSRDGVPIPAASADEPLPIPEEHAP